MEGRLVLDHCATLPTKTLSGKRIYLKGSGKGYFREILPVDTVFVMNSKIYLRKISQDNHLLLLSLLTSPPSVSLECLFCWFIRTGYPLHDISDISSSVDLSSRLSENTLTTVFYISRITFTDLKFRVIVKAVLDCLSFIFHSSLAQANAYFWIWSNSLENKGSYLFRFIFSFLYQSISTGIISQMGHQDDTTLNRTKRRKLKARVRHGSSFGSIIIITANLSM